MMKSQIKIGPKVSIIMATFNRFHYIRETLISIRNQSFKDWECLVIDDGCTDKTKELIENLAVQDSRFIYLKRPFNYNKGLSGSRNHGLDFARGRYLIFFDDDDIVHPENLSICLEVLQNNEWNFCRYNKMPFVTPHFDKKFNPVKKISPLLFQLSDLHKMITGKIPFASCCVMWKKECFEKERFNEKLMYAEEWECYSRILAKGYIGVSLDKVLYYNRKHPNSNTGEFHNNNPVRVNSKINATILIISNLASKNLINSEIKNFFLRLGFDLKSYRIIKLILDKSKADLWEKIKYKTGYLIYPFLRPILKLKAKRKTI
ncbi:glycosyltransferase involved in cell wall biosynthesis [Salegentibacter sp. 24]|uniref:glycosyltransferase family 2 protein n=1 Tax=Salegentibacter sp. 24 TaxID=2183986 RepID=UPI0010EC022B|nr:glycosyltransferase family 2 protein [Salegentibacter sp. 24]TDN89157.1 glycosyltransferase involved in cell wall biosynthesis [Salegentibacter sp. 24]